MRQQPDAAGGQGLRIIGVPMDLGQQRRGVDMGPSALRVARLSERLTTLGWEVSELGAVHVEEPEVCPVGEAHAKYLHEVRACGILCVHASPSAILLAGRDRRAGVRGRGGFR